MRENVPLNNLPQALSGIWQGQMVQKPPDEEEKGLFSVESGRGDCSVSSWAASPPQALKAQGCFTLVVPAAVWPHVDLGLPSLDLEDWGRAEAEADPGEGEGAPAGTRKVCRSAPVLS